LLNNLFTAHEYQYPLPTIPQ